MILLIVVVAILGAFGIGLYVGANVDEDDGVEVHDVPHISVTRGQSGMWWWHCHGCDDVGWNAEWERAMAEGHAHLCGGAW